MKLAFCFDGDDEVALEARGAMEYGPPDWNLVEQMVAEVELHLQAGKRLFVVDAPRGRVCLRGKLRGFRPTVARAHV